MMDLAGWGIATLLVMIAVIIHYESILTISDKILPWTQRHFRGRRTMIVLVAALMGAHVAEIWMFAIATMVMAQFPTFGKLDGEFDGSFWSYIYYTTANFTSLGNDGIRASGPLRSLVVLETLSGLMLIAWSASFTYLKMEQLWQTRRK